MTDALLHCKVEALTLHIQI